MNILMLTAGTGRFHCGTCLRDNTLAHGLRRRGHQVTLTPLYLPLVTDGPDASAGEPVRLGGVSAYLSHTSALFRAMPPWVSRALDSRAVLAMAARRAGATDPAALGPMTLSMLAGADGRQRKVIAGLTRALMAAPTRPDVVLLSNALLLGLAAPLREVLGVPVVCTLQGEDVFLDALPEAEREAAWTLVSHRARTVDKMVAVSGFYADEMRRRLNLEEGAVAVAYNGIELSGFTPAEGPPETPTVGFLARLCEDKGLSRLVDAFIALSETWDGPEAALWLGGAATARDKPALGAAIKRMRDAGLGDRLQVRTNMNLTDKQAFLRGLTVLCVPVQVSESFGLYALEAMACGVPVVAPARGALPELMEATGGGVLVSDDSPEALAEAIGGLLRDRARRELLGQAGREAVLARFGADRMAADVATILEEVAA